MLTVTLPCILIEMALDMALDDAKATLIMHEDHTGETNPHTAEEIVRLQAVQARLLASTDRHITLSAEDISSIDFYAGEWMSDRGLHRLTQDMIDH